MPWLSDYQGWSIFMDCDMLVLGDIAKLFALCDDRYAAMVVKHDHVPRESVKFLDLVWATGMGWLLFSDQPSQSTLLGGLIILVAERIAARSPRAAT